MTDTITEIEVLPLEKVIEQTLVRENITEKVIAELKDRYGDMRLKDVEDHEGYLDITEARKIVRKVGIAAEKICKAGREDAVRTQKLWLSKQSEILGKIAEVQDPLDAEIKRFEDEKERKELELARKREETFQSRQQSIIRLGATWQSDSFVLGEISYEVTAIKECDDEMWGEIVFPKYKRVFDRIEAERVAEETKRREADEKLQAEQEAFRKQQEEFRQQQEAFAKQKAEMEQMQQEQQRLKREAEDREAAEHRKKEHEALVEKSRQEEKLWRGRLDELPEVRWDGQTAFAKYDENVEVATYQQLISMTDAEFNQIKEAHKAKVAEAELVKIAEQQRISEEAEKFRLEELEKAKEQARKDELERIAADERNKAILAQQAEARRLEELAKAGDKANWDDFIGKLKAIHVPALKSGQYRRIAQIAKEKIEEAIALKP